ncbi:MAG: hypothetical protein HZB25_12730 [Candidatus Eisenbacteria bacterium]|nr:hypothetical protein [Candidatus Eisenbacteria bacterium]
MLEFLYSTTNVEFKVRPRLVGGLGGATTAIYDGSFSLTSNPAMLGWAEGSAVEATMRVARYDETRFVPLFDSFDQYLKETAVAENPSTYTGLNGGVVWKPAKSSPLTLAGGFFERYNFQYNFVDERRNGTGTDRERRDKLMGTQYITSNRALYSASGGAAYRFERFSAGATVHYYFGNLSLENRVVPGPVARAGGLDGPTVKSFSRDVSGVGATLGFAAEVDPRVTLAASYEFPVKLGTDWRTEIADSATHVNTSAVGHADTRYPGRWALGLAYRPRNTLRTVFSVDAVRTLWKDVSTGDSVRAASPALATVLPLAALRDTWEIRFGLEHTFYNNLPTRFGLFYRQAYAADEVDVAGISAGTGYKFDKFDVGIGAEVSKRNSRQAAITPRGSGDSKTDRVQDSMLRGVIDVRYHF